MKLRKLFALALASTLFVACDNDDNQIIDQGGTPQEGDGWVSLSVKSTSGMSTRALTPGKTQPGTLDETKVAGVTAIFFDGTLGTSKVTAVVPVPYSTAGDGPKEPTGDISDAFKVPASSKTVLIVVNPSNLPTITEYATTFNEVNAAVTDAAILNSVAKDGNFMMTNAKGDLEPSDASRNTISLTLHATAAAATGAPMVINVDRVVSKVRFYSAGAAVASASIATISDQQWVLNVTNKKYFPVSKRVATFANTLTPFDKYNQGSYRIDPNYNHAGWGTIPGASGSTYDDNYKFYSATAAPAAWVNPLDAATAGTAQYCLENTQQEVDNKHAYTTQILLQAKFMPKEYRLPDNSLSSAQELSQDWIRIDGGFYTYTTLLAWIEKELTAKYSSVDPTTYATPISSAFSTYLATLGITVTIPDAGTAAAVTALFTAEQANLEAKTDRAKTVGSVTYYAGGINYYKIMIKHDDTTAALNKLGEFGVVRNSVYDITVTKFNNPGYPNIPDPDPTTDDESETWLSVQININPWTWYSQNTEL